MENSSPQLPENDWASEIEENESENRHLIEKDSEESRRLHIHIRNRFHWSIWLITAVNFATFAGTLISAARLTSGKRCKEFTDIDAVQRTQGYCKQVIKS